MCGIAGFLTFGSRPAPLLGDDLTRMTDAIFHRGPDDAGGWVDADAGVALGHRRLSILDLSSAGRQPMLSASERYVLVYNGEIYNHRDLRTELEAAGAASAWRGHSDTEVLLAAVDHWGARETLERLNGMFAFALWDRSTRTLTLARDRLGEKPLYFGRMGDDFLFGSELKALTAHSSFVRDVNRGALAQYMRHNYVPAPHSIWRGIEKLLPGHFVEVRDGGRAVGPPVPYWDFTAVVHAGAAAPRPDEPGLVDDLERLLKDAIGRRMEADVPLGAFLSGGVDSSLIVALMQAQSARPVRTFTIGFQERGYNEAVHAKAVAKHLGADHTELYVMPSDALALIPKLPRIWDEPFADSSQIPTLLVSEMTRRHVTVSLSGDGGDELFGGYSRYFLGMRLWNATSKLPHPIRKLFADRLRARSTIEAVSMFMRLMPSRYRHRGLADRLPRVAQILEEPSPEALYLRLVSHFTEPESIVRDTSEPLNRLFGADINLADFRQKMMYLDTLTYLPDDILAKVDRASMAYSLEVRVPFLDHRVVEYAWSLPMSAKIRGGKGKSVLRQILDRHVPRALVDRPKMGFGVPIGAWLNGPLRDWAEDLLDEARLREEGVFHPEPVRALWAEHSSGKRNWHYHLWNVLMFQAWWAEHRAQTPALGIEPRRREIIHA